jgi:hypothetical protein
MKMLSTALLLVVLALITSASKCNPNPPPPDAAVPVSSCSTACARGAALQCVWAQPTPLGASCSDVCVNAAHTVPWDVARLTSASACQ